MAEAAKAKAPKAKAPKAKAKAKGKVPSEPKTDVVDVGLGCSKCRWSKKGCARCKARAGM
jgi:hypothetical protein